MTLLPIERRLVFGFMTELVGRTTLKSVMPTTVFSFCEALGVPRSVVGYVLRAPVRAVGVGARIVYRR
jgi:hypothetical protein